MTDTAPSTDEPADRTGQDVERDVGHGARQDTSFAAMAERLPVALVVEDDPSVRAVVARQLIRLGWAVRALPSAEAALAWIGESADAEQPRLVVSDVDMPGLSGLELAAILRRDHPTLGVLLLSGRAAPGLTALALPALPLPALALPAVRARGARDVGGARISDGAPAAAGTASSVWILGKPYGMRALGDAVERTVLYHWRAPHADASV